MIFDKTKAMRNAEKYVVQGKLRAAIAEYKAVVSNDPRDIGTMNMLGDLYAKNMEKREAVECYLKVAEHYSTQGFAQKAIAVYNKISRLQPDSIEVSTKLAELYKLKGSLSEARAHYTTLAEHYEKSGRRIEALSMWKQIALLDPNNTEVCVSLAESYLREGHRDEAAEAYAEAGTRFSRQGGNEEAIKVLMKGHEIRPNDLRILDGLVKAYSALGRVGKAVTLLEDILAEEPYNRDVLYLLIDCHIDSQNAAGAERAVIKLVELEPANYPKLLDLIRIYLNANDPDSATRILSMSSEYLLAAGQGDECNRWITEILERDHKHISALRLLVRYCSWVKDEQAYVVALVRLAEAAREKGEAEDERFALSTLVAIRPLEAAFAERLAQVIEENGFEYEAIDTELVQAQFSGPVIEVPEELAEVSVVEHSGFVNAGDLFEQKLESHMSGIEIERGGFEVIATAGSDDEHVPIDESSVHIDPRDDVRLNKEIDSIAFYIDNNYRELAEKAIEALTAEFGDRSEIRELSAKLAAASTVTEEQMPVEAHPIGIEEMRSEFGLDDAEASTNEDYETHYATAIAYQEMGLMENAIREYQDAINLASPNDGSRRFFHCANLLGHCFMQNSMPNFAVTWYLRALESPDLSDDEKQGLWYELALAYDAENDAANAARYFEMVYAENVDFRDVAERVKNIYISH